MSSSNQDYDEYNDAKSQVEKKSRFPPFNNALSEDEEVVKKFADTLQSKLDHKMISPTPNERAVIRKVVFLPGFIYGSLATAATFVFLRRAPIHVVNKLAMKRYKYVKENVKHVAAMEGNKPPEPFKEGPLAKTIGTSHTSPYYFKLCVRGEVYY